MTPEDVKGPTVTDDANRACQATSQEELERQIMSPMVPKNEREHWASGEIHRLRDIIEGGCPSHPKVRHSAVERKCQASCGHTEQHHVRAPLGDGLAVCHECLKAGRENEAYHPFETLESLRAEVEALTAERDEAAATIAAMSEKLRIERAYAAALSQIALTDDALREALFNNPSPLTSLRAMEYVYARIRAARGVKEGG